MENKTNKITFVDSYQNNIGLLKRYFRDDDTIKFRKFSKKNRVCVVYADGMVNKIAITKNIITPIVSQKIRFNSKDIIETLKNDVLVTAGITTSNQVEDVVEKVLKGYAVLIVEDCKEVIVLNTKGYKTRSLDEPMFENVIRGPRDAFTEALLTNVSLVRRRISDNKLKFKYMDIGKITKTKICVTYHEEKVDKAILQEVERRLETIEVDLILEAAHIKKFIKDKIVTPFELIGSTERPDKLSADIMDGKIGIIVDESPFALIVPYLFQEYFKSAEDNYVGYWYAYFNRIMRYLAFFITISLPALYVSLITYHQELIPNQLLISISSARKGVPLPTFVEVLVLLFVFEILREGGARIPSTIGTTISFIGAIVLGEGAVSARFVSYPMVIIVAITGISNFLIPRMVGAVNIIRFILLFMSFFLGLYGFFFGFMGVFVHLMSLESFGVSYMKDIGKAKSITECG